MLKFFTVRQIFLNFLVICPEVNMLFQKQLWKCRISSTETLLYVAFDMHSLMQQKLFSHHFTSVKYIVFHNSPDFVFLWKFFLLLQKLFRIIFPSLMQFHYLQVVLWKSLSHWYCFISGMIYVFLQLIESSRLLLRELSTRPSKVLYIVLDVAFFCLIHTMS